MIVAQCTIYLRVQSDSQSYPKRHAMPLPSTAWGHLQENDGDSWWNSKPTSAATAIPTSQYYLPNLDFLSNRTETPCDICPCAFLSRIRSCHGTPACLQIFLGVCFPRQRPRRGIFSFGIFHVCCLLLLLETFRIVPRLPRYIGNRLILPLLSSELFEIIVFQLINGIFINHYTI